MTDINIPDEYKEKSRQIEQLWEVFLETGENLDRVVIEMRTILIDVGMGATEAMNKIVQDHKHLKGFSRATLYRMLPAEEKRHKEPHDSKRQFSNENYTPEDTKPNVSNETYNIPPTKPNVVDVTPPLPPAEPKEQGRFSTFTATDESLRRENEKELIEQLLREERAKNAVLKERLEQKDGELEDHAYKIQELTRRLTAATTQVIDIDDNTGEVDKPTFEQHWNQLVDAECSFCHKITPLIIRHFISGKVVKWIDRDRYKELYGMVPQQE